MNNSMKLIHISSVGGLEQGIISLCTSQHHAFHNGSSIIVIIFTSVHSVCLEGGGQGPSYAFSIFVDGALRF